MTAAITDADRAAAYSLLIGGKVAGGDGQTYYLKQPKLADAEQAFAAHRIQARKEAIEEAAAYLDGYAGGHYMAQSCAAAIRALATDGEK